MAEYGFGYGPFGAGPFGRAHTSKDALWRRSIPLREKQDDAENDNHLERYLEVAAEALDRILETAWGFPEQIDPVTARSGQEYSESLTLIDIEDLGAGVVRVTVDPSQTEIVEIMFGASTDPDTDNLRQDGWVASVDGFDIFQISRVRAYDEESDPVGAATLDVVTNREITSPLEVRPPDILFRLASNFAPTVDRADPPDYSRRALYRHRLIRDLKVSTRLFELLGAIYGFDVEVSGLYCISEAWYNALLETDPLNAFELPEGSGKYFTDIPLFGHLYDQVPADVIPADLQTDADFAIEIGPAVEVSENRWCFQVTPDELDRVLALGFWQIVDADGVAHYIEEVNLSEPVTAEDTGVVSTGSRGPYSLVADRPPMSAGSLVVTWTDKDLVTRTATDDGVGALTGDGTGTVDYTTGDIEITTDEFTDGGTPSDWIPSDSPIAGLPWNDAYVVEPASTANPKGGSGAFDPDEPFVGWMAGDDGYLAFTVDGGQTWETDPDFPFTEDELNGVDGDFDTTAGSDVTVWVVGEDRLSQALPGGVWYWSYDNEVWTEVTHSVPSGWRDVAAFDGSSGVLSILAVGYGGEMAYYDGTTMLATGAGTTANDLNAASMEDSAAHQTFVVGDSGTLLEVTAWGTVGDFATATWTDQSSALGGGIADDLRDISFLTTDAAKGILVGDNSQVWITTDNGATWSSVATGFSKDWVACFWQGATAGDFIVLAADDGTVIVSVDQGSSWSTSDIPVFGDTLIGGAVKDIVNGTAHPYGVLVGSNGTTWYYAEDGRIPVADSGSPFLLDYTIDEVCVISDGAPVAGSGFLRAQAQFLCNRDYRPAAVYRIVAEPDEVLTEPGAVVTNLVDRIEEKLRLYVPIHIRLTEFVVFQVATVDLFGDSFSLSGEDFILDEAEADAIGGTRFDTTPADVEPLDEGAFFLEGTLTIT